MARGTKRIDLVGRRFGRLVVTALSHTTNRRPYWHCRCDCGAEKTVVGGNLRYGITQSCGCKKIDELVARRRRHGMRGHPAYQNWSSMRARCENPTNNRYSGYGGRGIKVCERWRDFAAFWEDMGHSWAPGLTVERNDVNRDYEPDNCRWATMAEQAVNKRKVRMVETPWGLMTLADAARKANLDYHVIWSRLRLGWTGADLFKPVSI